MKKPRPRFLRAGPVVLPQNYSTFNTWTVNEPAGASTWTLSPASLFISALPSGDSFEMRRGSAEERHGESTGRESRRQ